MLDHLFPLSPDSAGTVFSPAGLISIASEVTMLHMDQWQDSKYSRRQKKIKTAAQHVLSNAVGFVAPR